MSSIALVGKWLDSNLRRGLVALVAIKVIGLVLIFDVNGGQNAFDLPKTVFSRATEWLLLALLAMALVRYGTAIVPATRIHIGVIAYVAANALSAVFAEDPYVAVFGTQERLLGLAFVVDMAVLYFAVAIAFREWKDWLALGLAFAAASIATASYAIVQALGLDPILWARGDQMRPFSTLGNADVLGHFLGLVFGGGLGAIVSARRPAVVLFGAVFALLAIALSAVVATRGSALGLPMAVAAAVVIYLLLNGLRIRAVTRLAVPLIAIVAIFVLIAFTTPLGERVRVTIESPTARAAQTMDRVLVFESAAKAFLDRPILGWGPDNMGVAFPRYRAAEFALFAGPGQRNIHAHNWLLHAAATTGLVGTVPLVVLITGGAWILIIRGLPKQPVVAVPLLIGSAAYWSEGLVTVGTIGVDWFPWVAWGAAATLGSVRRAVVVHRLPKAFIVGATASALVLGAFGINLLQANRAVRMARETTDTRLIPSGAAEEAVARDPGRADYWNELGRARFAAGDFTGAEAAFLNATARSPYEPDYWGNVARARVAEVARNPDVKGLALDAARRGVRSDPNDPLPRIALAEVAIALGANRDALEAAVEAIQLYPFDARYDQLAARAAFGMTDFGDARGLLRPALNAKDSPTLRVAVAKLSLALRDLPAARADALRALQLDPTNADAKSVLAASGG